MYKYALNALDYYGDDVIRREIPRMLAKEGPTDDLAYYLSGHADLFQPAARRLADSIIPFLNSNSAETAGAAVHSLDVLMPLKAVHFSEYPQPRLYIWKEQPAVPKMIEDAVWAAVPHIRTFTQREALLPLVKLHG